MLFKVDDCSTSIPIASFEGSLARFIVRKSTRLPVQFLKTRSGSNLLSFNDGFSVMNHNLEGGNAEEEGPCNKWNANAETNKKNLSNHWMPDYID